MVTNVSIHFGVDGHLSTLLFGKGWQAIYTFMFEGIATNLPIHFWRDGHQSSHACRWRRPLMYFSIRRELPPIYFSIWDGMATIFFSMSGLFGKEWPFMYFSIWEGMVIYPFCIWDRIATNLSIHWGVATLEGIVIHEPLSTYLG